MFGRSRFGTQTFLAPTKRQGVGGMPATMRRVSHGVPAPKKAAASRSHGLAGVSLQRQTLSGRDFGRQRGPGQDEGCATGHGARAGLRAGGQLWPATGGLSTGPVLPRTSGTTAACTHELPERGPRAPTAHGNVGPALPRTAGTRAPRSHELPERGPPRSHHMRERGPRAPTNCWKVAPALPPHAGTRAPRSHELPERGPWAFHKLPERRPPALVAGLLPIAASLAGFLKPGPAGFCCGWVGASL